MANMTISLDNRTKERFTHFCEDVGLSASSVITVCIKTIVRENRIPFIIEGVGRLLQDGDTVTFGTHTFTVMRTPGHSHGSALFYSEAEKTVFTGDTLFRMSIGRTDFPEGSWKEMEQSLHNVVARLPQETVVLPGHGPKTSIADEMRYNPYLK